MPQLIEVPGYGQVEFPDDMNDQQITAAIQSNMPMEAPKQSMIAEGALSPMERTVPEKKPGVIESIANSIPIQFALGAGDQFTNAFKKMANTAVDILPKNKYLDPSKGQEKFSIPMVKNGEGTAYNVGEVAGDIGAFLASGGPATKALGGLASLIPKAGKVGGVLSKGAQSLMGNGFKGGLARRAIGSGLYGLSQADEGKRLGDAATMAGTSAVVDSLFGGLGALKPSRFFRGTAPIEDVIQNARAAQGTETPLGTITQSPMLKRQFENILPNVPFSGAAESQVRTARSIGQKGEDLLESYRHDIAPEAVNDAIVEELKSSYQNQNALKRKLYEGVETLASKLGFGVGTNKFESMVNKYKDAIGRSNFLINEPDVKGLMAKLSGFSEGFKGKSNPGGLVDQFGKPFRQDVNTSLNEANILQAKLSDLAKKLKQSPLSSERGRAAVLGSLSSALRQDIKTSMKNFGNKELTTAFDAAQKNYAQNFSKFLDKDIYKLIGGKKDPAELLTTIIKTGRNNDRGDLIKKFMDVLSPKGQDLIKYSYLSRAIGDEGVINPMTLKSIISSSKLGQNQLNQLFRNPGELGRIKDLGKLVKMNEAGIKQFENPTTGARAMSALPYALASAAGLYGGEQAGGNGLIGGLVAPILAAKGARKYLTSSKVRDKLVKKMIENEEKGISAGLLQKSLTPALGGLLTELFR